jgi:hypothetical protein
MAAPLSGADCMIRRGDTLRWMYRGHRPNLVATVLNRWSARLASAGVGPGRLVTLEVRGRRSGRVISLPVVLAEYDGERYLAPGGRPHIPVDRRAPLAEFEQVAARYPVFRIHQDAGGRSA